MPASSTTSTLPCNAACDFGSGIDLLAEQFDREVSFSRSPAANRIAECEHAVEFGISQRCLGRSLVQWSKRDAPYFSFDIRPDFRRVTPTYSSWLNQVDIWFARIEREVIARGVFTSVPDLARKLRRYINAYSASARPVQWKYSGPSRRIHSNELSATGH
jgi:hypothetical protein